MEDSLDEALASALLGVELLMQAGVRELVKIEKGRPADSPDDDTIRYLMRSTELLATSSRWC